MAEAMKKVLELFRAREWNFELDEKNQLVRSGINGDNGQWKIILSPSASPVSEQLRRERKTKH